MMWLCKLIGCNHKVCAYTEWLGDHLFQRFACSRCGEISSYWGYVLKYKEQGE